MSRTSAHQHAGRMSDLELDWFLGNNSPFPPSLSAYFAQNQMQMETPTGSDSLVTSRPIGSSRASASSRMQSRFLSSPASSHYSPSSPSLRCDSQQLLSTQSSNPIATAAVNDILDAEGPSSLPSLEQTINSSKDIPDRSTLLKMNDHTLNGYHQPGRRLGVSLLKYIS
jgi:hypothetical protein